MGETNPFVVIGISEHSPPAPLTMVLVNKTASIPGHLKNEKPVSPSFFAFHLITQNLTPSHHHYHYYYKPSSPHFLPTQRQ